MPLLSIVIGTTEPWPAIRATLDSIYGQAQTHGAEIIIADGTTRGLPADVADRYPGIIWLKSPAKSIFGLRGAGVSRATGDVVAMTEDHCLAACDWCANILRAHAEHPEAAVIGGGVENGYPDKLRDWAHHFLVFGPALPPIDLQRREPIWCVANIAWARSAVARMPKQGVVEMLFIRQLRAEGVKFIADPSIVVHHRQSYPLLSFCGYHFHNGRSIAAARLSDLGLTGRAARLIACGILPIYIVAVRFRQLWPKRKRRRELLFSLPWLMAFCIAHSCGEFAGYLTGAGLSPEHLR